MGSRIWRGLAAGFAVFFMMMNTPRIEAAQLARHLHKTTLENGLTLLVKETPGNKAATVQLWVKTGSVYEESSEAGITHLIEHMIFKGTETMGPGALAEAIEGAGGRINAYTSYEYTVYHATLAARHWERALEVLTDAVLHSTFDPAELAREKPVVLEELRMRHDRPASRLFETLMANAYTAHPYRLPIIGSRESVAGFSRQNIVDYMAKNYHPENFTVVVVGDVHFAEVLDRVNALLADLPKSGVGRPELPQEPMPEGARFFMMEEDVTQTQLALALPIAPFSSPDTPVLDVIAQILGQGETSRLYHELRDTLQLVYQINGTAFTPHDAGLLEVTAVLEAKNVEPAVGAIMAEIFKLKHLPVSEAELMRAKTNLESEFVFNLEQVEGQARVLGTFEMLAGDPREDDYLEKIRAVSREDILRVAGTYFKGERCTVGVLAPRDSAVSLDAARLPALIDQAEAQARAGLPASLVPDAFLGNVHRFELANGIRLLVREDHEVPTVGIQAVFPGGLRGETRATSGAFAFISELLPRGTERMTAREFAVAVGDMAGNISGFNGKNTFGLRADFLSRYFDNGMQLVRDVIRTPAFAPEEVEKVRPELLAALRQQEDALAAVAFREFNRLLFQGHPYGLNTQGAEDAIRRLDTAALRAIYRQHAGPDKMVLAVAGDVDPERVRTLVEELFGDWQGSVPVADASTEESFLPPESPAAPASFTLPRAKEQTHIVVGFLGTTLTAADRFAVEVMETILSGQSGRLFAELRDKQSLAYSLSAFAMLGLDTGSVGVYIGTSPDKRDEAVAALWRELRRLRDTLPGEDELKRAKNVLIGQYELGVQTHGAQALEMALNEEYGLGQDFGSRYVEGIGQVDAQAVRAAAIKYIQPDQGVRVTVGAVNDFGKAPAAVNPPGDTPGDTHEP
ncbi:MAG: peptidase M16 [Desulfobacterales bacterium CG2_30_60_27]|nr:MAG: peptidase M16 [Desulfobacterales bacterium CG2_30_60_27]